MFEWPLAAAALAQGRLADAIGHARALLEPPQQRLPEALAREVQRAVEAWDLGLTSEAQAQMQRATALAQQMGYL